jgi:hypothetical protein
MCGCCKWSGIVKVQAKLSLDYFSCFCIKKCLFALQRISRRYVASWHDKFITSTFCFYDRLRKAVTFLPARFVNGFQFLVWKLNFLGGFQIGNEYISSPSLGFYIFNFDLLANRIELSIIEVSYLFGKCRFSTEFCSLCEWCSTWWDKTFYLERSKVNDLANASDHIHLKSIGSLLLPISNLINPILLIIVLDDHSKKLIRI